MAVVSCQQTQVNILSYYYRQTINSLQKSSSLATFYYSVTSANRAELLSYNP